MSNGDCVGSTNYEAPILYDECNTLWNTMINDTDISISAQISNEIFECLDSTFFNNDSTLSPITVSNNNNSTAIPYASTEIVSEKSEKKDNNDDLSDSEIIAIVVVVCIVAIIILIIVGYFGYKKYNEGKSGDDRGSKSERQSIITKGNRNEQQDNMLPVVARSDGVPFGVTRDENLDDDGL